MARGTFDKILLRVIFRLDFNLLYSIFPVVHKLYVYLVDSMSSDNIEMVLLVRSLSMCGSWGKNMLHDSPI